MFFFSILLNDLFSVCLQILWSYPSHCLVSNIRSEVTWVNYRHGQNICEKRNGCVSGDDLLSGPGTRSRFLFTNHQKRKKMADETVEHRFIQIHHACENVSEPKTELWSTLALKSTSVIATSHICEKVYNQVILNESDLLSTVQNFQTLVITCNELSKNVIFLRTLTRLLMFNLNSRKNIHFEHVKYVALKNETAKSISQVHPFAVIMRQKPSLYYHLLDEIDYLLTNFGSGQVLQILSGFVTSVFFLENMVEASALINRFTSHISSSNASTFVPQLYELATEILRNYPLHKDDVHYFCLVDWLILLNTNASMWGVLKNDVSITKFMYTLVDRLLTTVTDGFPIVSHLIRLERILIKTETDFNFDVMWISLSYALLKVQTIDEQISIVRIMMNMIHLDAASNIILRIAYIPYYQLMSELNDKGASKDMVEFKNQVLNMISFLDNNESSFKHAEDRFTKVTIKNFKTNVFKCVTFSYS